MSDFYVGEMFLTANLFAPRSTMFCEGQELSVARYQLLYSLIGNAYGGSGSSSFNIPDLRGRLDNRMPGQGLNHIICWNGSYPPRS